MTRSIHRVEDLAHKGRAICWTVVLRRVAWLAAAVLLAYPQTVGARMPPLPELVLRAFEVRATLGPEREKVRRRIQFAAPKGWTPSSAPGAPELELVGPGGEGALLVFAAFHPSQLTPVLDRLREEHPGAAPSPPEQMDLVGLRPEFGERATRFVISGRELGEIVMIERGETIVLFVVIVAPEAWPEVRSLFARVYPTLTVTKIAVNEADP